MTEAAPESLEVVEAEVNPESREPKPEVANPVKAKVTPVEAKAVSEACRADSIPPFDTPPPTLDEGC